MGNQNGLKLVVEPSGFPNFKIPPWAGSMGAGYGDIAENQPIVNH